MAALIERNEHIILIDDHQILLDGLEMMLIGAGYDNIDKIATNAEIEKYLSHPYGDILLLDINIGSHNGLDILKKVKDQIQVVLLSSYSDARLIREAIKHGAKGYLSKQTASSHVIKAIEAVSQGREYFDPIIQEIINKSFAHVEPNVVTTAERPMYSMLSEREKQVLELIRAEYTSEEIAVELYISKSTVDTYRKNLIEKFGVRNSVGLVSKLINNEFK